ncbi:unnamed protein product [Dovyalis caffra]|uniref:Pectinesterase n=1 Tax=Dovyalis caffra TaxID=77055 RepID=A0AAV1S3D8_9ROSI|nr:unnamed protein product [Dovyalis caffra]
MSQEEVSFTEISDSGKQISFSKKNKKLQLAPFAFLLLVATIASILTQANSENNSNKNAAAYSIIKMSCSSARYPELCYSAIVNAPGAAANLASIKDGNDVIKGQLKAATRAVKDSNDKINEIQNDPQKRFTKPQVDALSSSKDNNDYSGDALNKAHAKVDQAKADLLKYYKNEIPLSDQQAVPDINTPVSSCLSYQDTVMDGFSHSIADKQLRDSISDGVDNVKKLCSNILAMINKKTDEGIAKELKSTKRNLKEENDRNESGWPKWLSVADKRLLQSSSLTPDVVVAADGSGNYSTVSAAVAAAPTRSSKRYIIRIKAGVYRETVQVPINKTNLMFLGDGRSTTIITASRSVVDGITTFHSATVGNFRFSLHFAYCSFF